MSKKPLLSICRTCMEPKPGKAFRRYEDELRSRHDSCIECEDSKKFNDARQNPRAKADTTGCTTRQKLESSTCQRRSKPGG